MSSHRLPASSLYLFQLPADVLAQLQPRQLVIPPDHPLHPANRTHAAPTAAAAGDDDDANSPPTTTAAGAYTCALTGASFDSLEGLKQHYRTDWYRYNVRLRLQGKPTPVSEQAFNQLVEDLSDSISGSDSSSSADTDSSSTYSSSSRPAASTTSDPSLSRLLAKQSLSSPSPSAADTEAEEALLAGPKSPLQWFDAPRSAANGGLETQYGIHRAALPLAGARKRLLPSAEEGSAVLSELRAVQLAPEREHDDEEDKKWTMLMFGGGHFAGWVVSLRPKLVGVGKGKPKERELVVLESKTFHRYTTRRKQGGGQGANDAANGKAKSAGAQIRRHNEAMLNEEVGALLTSWSSHIATSQLIFLRASKSSYKTFFFPSSPLVRGDPRIRGFGFPTKRPTLSELARSFAELTRVKVGHLTADELDEMDRAYLKTIAPPPSTAAPVSAKREEKVRKEDEAPKLSKEEEVARDRWTRLVEMVKKGRLDAARTFLDKYGADLGLELDAVEQKEGEVVWGVLPDWMPEARATPTLLHLASSSSQPSLVRLFLSPPYNASPYPYPPSTSSPAARAPYDLAPSRPTRNEFRFAFHREPTKWDWAGRARVGGPLDEEVEREKERREEEKRERLRAREREREEAERARDEEERRAQEAMRDKARELAAGAGAGGAGPKRLGGGPPMPVRERERAGLSEEQKMRVVREERARAAEARLKRLGG